MKIFYAVKYPMRFKRGDTMIIDGKPYRVVNVKLGGVIVRRSFRSWCRTMFRRIRKRLFPNRLTTCHQHPGGCPK